MTTHHPLASYEAPPRVQRRTRSSFDCSDIHQLASLLRRLGYDDTPVKSQYEAYRLIHGGSIAVVYRSGAVLCQGSDPQPLITVLENCEAESEQEAQLCLF